VAKRDADEDAIRAAVAQMPYGALVTSRYKLPSRQLTLGDVADYLAALHVVLAEIAKSNEVEHRELIKLQQDVAGMRRLFGLGDGGGL
jgi:hypothetical protein